MVSKVLFSVEPLGSSSNDVKIPVLSVNIRDTGIIISKGEIEMKRDVNSADHGEDSWIGILWKPAAAIIYLLICLFDFVVVPVYMGLWAPKLHEIIMAIKDLPADAQIVVLNLELAPWEPLTLKGGGLFHVAFGAILGATVWTRGQERVNEIRQGWGGRGGYDRGYDDGGYSAPYNGNPGMVTPTPMVVNNQVTTIPNGAQIDNPDENG